MPHFWCPPFLQWLSSFAHAQQALVQEKDRQFSSEHLQLFENADLGCNHLCITKQTHAITDEPQQLYLL